MSPRPRASRPRPLPVRPARWPTVRRRSVLRRARWPPRPRRTCGRSWPGGGTASPCGPPNNTVFGAQRTACTQRSRPLSRGARTAWCPLITPSRRSAGRAQAGRERADLRRRVPGLGPVCARPLGLDLPELGPLRRQHRAALVGLAPLHRDSGTLRGTRTIWGGRAQVRTALEMSPLVAVRSPPVRKALYQRLRAAGKLAKVALTACMRKLLTMLKAMVKHRIPWPPQEVSRDSIFP